MNRWRFVLRSLRFHLRIHASVALGVAAATAVLTGALIVGDSVRGSLRALSLERLGRIDQVLVGDRFFRDRLVEDLRRDEALAEAYPAFAPAILLPSVAAERQTGSDRPRASQVLAIGCDQTFWEMGVRGIRPERLPGAKEVVLNRPLAEELGALGAYLGVTPDRDAAQVAGVRLSDVDPVGPAEEAGIRTGDVIVRLGNRPVKDLQDFRDAVETLEADQPVSLVVLRDGRRFEAGVLPAAHEIVLRLPKANQVPADSPLGSKADRVQALAGLKVIQVLDAEGLGRFSLRSQQTNSMNAYVALDTLQSALDEDGRVNAVLAAGSEPGVASSEQSRELLASRLQPQLEDYGLRLQRIRRVFQPEDGDAEVIYDYANLTTERMIFAPAVERTVLKAWAEHSPQPVLTYLATSIEPAAGEHPGIPYSLVTAVDSVSGLGPLLDDSGRPIQPGDGIVLNRWAAEDLDVRAGERVTLEYFLPEATHAETSLPTDTYTAKVEAIVPLTEPAAPYGRRREAEFDERPTLVNDPDLTPVVEGVTDQESISRWEAPFPVDYSRVRPEDDEYWENHRTTPKAFVSLQTGQQLWGSRFGEVTSFRIAVPPERAGDEQAVQAWMDGLRKRLVHQLASVQEQLGLAFQPVKAQALEAASGTTDFAELFLGLSFFVIAAALLLVALLFRLGIEQRASEIGILFATGFRNRSVAWLLSLEGLIVAAVGGVLGVGFGVGYAALMLYGLRTWWVGAVTTPFLRLYVESPSLVIGGVCGLFVSLVAIVVSVRRARQIPVRELLAGRAGEDRGVRPARERWTWWLALLSVILAMGLVVQARNLGGMAQAGAFVGAGFLVLIALLAVIRGYLRGGRRRAAAAAALGLPGLSARSAARNPGRSTLTIGLMATATFLIVAMSAFRLAPSVEGTGGFDLMAQTTIPLFHDLNDPQERQELLADRASVLEGGTVVSLRLKPGEDASCNNLYQATRPAVLGVPESFVRFFDEADQPGFAWAGSAAETDAERANPWRLLNQPAGPTDSPVPVIMDASMATYSLHLKGVGDEYSIRYPSGETVRFRVVGLLAGSVLQGRLLIGERDFLRIFPEVNGYRFFLIQCPSEAARRVRRALEERLSDQGFDATSTVDRLQQLFAVQNTYLTTFQSLGALGLLLGTFGLATVQLRNVLERRGELALLRAVGFRPGRLARIVLLENFMLLFGGVLTGTLAAVIAVLPHAIFGGTSPPTWDLLILLGLVLAVGLVSSLLPVRATLRAPVVAALRGN